jgi:hypothetical protein
MLACRDASYSVDQSRVSLVSRMQGREQYHRSAAASAPKATRVTRRMVLMLLPNVQRSHAGPLTSEYDPSAQPALAAVTR